MLRFELIESLSLPGDPDKPNDDAFGVIESAAVVFDGATSLNEPLMPGRSDAAWLAQFGARRLLAHLNDGDAPEYALKNALTDAERSFNALARRPPEERYEIPYAAMMLLAETDQGVEALWFGDCGCLVKRPGESAELLGEALLKKDAERDAAAKLSAARNVAPAASSNLTEFLPFLRAARNSLNTEDGGWAFAPDPQAAEHVSRVKFAAPLGTVMLLATDGFLALMSDYQRHDADTLIAAALSKGLQILGDEIRDIEKADSDGRRYPRFKTSDDATALLLRVASVVAL